MWEYLEYLKNPFIAGGLAGLLVVAFAYLDVWMNDRRDVENSYYYKLFFGVGLMVGFLVYLAGNNSGHLIKKGGGSVGELKSGGRGRMSGGGDSGDNIKTIVQKLGEGGIRRGHSLDIYTDAPDF